MKNNIKLNLGIKDKKEEKRLNILLKRMRKKKDVIDKHLVTMTQLEASKLDDYRDLSPIFTRQKNIVRGFDGKGLILSKRILNLIDIDIINWMEECTNDSSLGISLSSKDEKIKITLSFKKYIVNFQNCSNCRDTYMLVKCTDNSIDKIWSKYLGSFGLNGGIGDRISFNKLDKFIDIKNSLYEIEYDTENYKIKNESSWTKDYKQSECSASLKT